MPPETLGQLVGQFAHEINNLLAAALVGVELAAQAVQDDKVRALLASAVDTIARQRELTGAMGRAARACASEQRVDVHELLLACRDALAAELAPARLELRLEAAQATVCCDATFLRRALLHLAANARAAMQGGAGRLSISTCNRTAPTAWAGGDVLVLTARDDGLGMPAPVQRRAFEPFFSTQPHAAGLGLPQVRDTLRRAGGTAVLESVEGQGTAVHLTFPLAP